MREKEVGEEYDLREHDVGTGLVEDVCQDDDSLFFSEADGYSTWQQQHMTMFFPEAGGRSLGIGETVYPIIHIKSAHRAAMPKQGTSLVTRKGQMESDFDSQESMRTKC